MELEVEVLDKLLNAVGLANLHGAETGIHVIDKIGDMTARLINRGKPAGYVVTDTGTFMVTVEKISRAVMASE